MKAEELERIVDRRLNICSEVLTAKNNHYNPAEDALDSFKKAGRAKNIHPTKALDGMLLKHIVSMWDIVDGISEGKGLPSMRVVTEKFTDIINYILLLEALIEEAREASEAVWLGIEEGGEER